MHLDKAINIFLGMNKPTSDSQSKAFYITEPQLLKISDIGKIGMDYNDITMKEIEIDYLCIPSNKYEMNDEIEGTFEDWNQSASEFENDTSILLVKNDEIIGYCDMYPITKESYETVISGKSIIRGSMIDVIVWVEPLTYISL